MIQNKRIIFRADGNSRIGLGHLIRSLALANMLKADFECLFLTQAPAPDFLSTLEKAGIKYFSLEPTPDYEQEATALVNLVQPSDVVVLDGYGFGTIYQQKLKNNGNKVVCLDDIHAFPFVADVIINQAGGVKLDQYQVENYSRLYLGPAYALLREPFLQAAFQTRIIRQIKSLLLNMGGADPDNQTLHLLKMVLVNYSHLNIAVVTGSAYAHKSALQQFVQDYPAVTLHQNLDAEGMCGLMKACDAAILPPSSVSYEWCSVSGLLFVHQIADNQKDMAAFLIQNELAFPIKKFGQILNQPELNSIIAQQVNRQREYFDGKSKIRLRRIFFDLILPDALQLRTAQEKDMELLFTWANDPEVRKHSFNPAPIPLEMHQRWFSVKITDPNCLIFLALVAGDPAGMIRYDIKEKEATISYLLNKEFRGKGLGSWVLAAGTTALQQHRPDVNRILGHVQQNNLASINSFRKAGFTQTLGISPAEPNSVVFVKSLN